VAHHDVWLSNLVRNAREPEARTCHLGQIVGDLEEAWRVADAVVHSLQPVAVLWRIHCHKVGQERAREVTADIPQHDISVSFDLRHDGVPGGVLICQGCGIQNTDAAIGNTYSMRFSRITDADTCMSAPIWTR
jgi:hypothetical protein